MSERMPERPLVGEPLALDLVNTQWRADGELQDLLTRTTDAQEWLATHELTVSADEASVIQTLKQAREALRCCLETEDQDPQACQALNDVLEHGHVTPCLAEGAAAERTQVEPAWGPAWAAARDYVRLRQQYPRWRIRACAHPECILYFLDTTRNGTRRWCDMRTCGNRAKAQRYQRRHRAPP